MRRLACEACEDALFVPFCYSCNTSDYIVVVEADSKEADITYVMENLEKPSTTVHWSVMFEFPAIVAESTMSKFEILNMLRTTDFVINLNEHIVNAENMVVPVIGISFTNVETEDDDGLEDIAYSAYIEL